MSYTYKYPRAAITNDIVVMHNESVLFIKRKHDPFQGCLALPGGFFDCEKDASLCAGALRELKEETNLDLDGMMPAMFLDEPERDPRGRVVSVVWLVDITDEEAATIKAGDDAADFCWIPVLELDNYSYAFDHGKALKKIWSSP